jgi:hypothetical protein
MSNINVQERILLVIGLIVLLVLVPLLRLSTGSPIGESQETYAVLNAHLLDGSAHLYDVLVYLSYTSFGEVFTLFAIPLLLGVATMLLSFVLIQKIPLTAKQKLYALGILISAPSFLHAFVGLSVYQLLLPLVLLILVLYDYSVIASALTFLLLVINYPFVGFFSAIFIAWYFLSQKNKPYTAAVLLVTIAGLFLSELFALTTHQFTLEANTLFSFFGANYGFSLFILLLGGYGILVHGKPTLYLQVLRSALILCSLFYEPIRFITLAVLSIYAAFAFDDLLKRKWIHQTTGNFAIVLCLCILLFSSVVVLKEQVDMFPSASHDAITTTLAASPLTRTVLTDPIYAEFYRYKGLDVVGNSYTKKGIEVSENMFSAQTYPSIKPLFAEYQVTTVVIDTPMRYGRIWQRDDQGLLFLINNNEHFSLDTQVDDVLVYSVSND